jgi:hypothetical protein
MALPISKYSLLIPLILLPLIAVIPISLLYYLRGSYGIDGCKYYTSSSRTQLSVYFCCDPEYYIVASAHVQVRESIFQQKIINHPNK